MKKAIFWIALLPVVLIVGMMAFSPKSTSAPAATAQASTQGVAQASTTRLTPTATPVMYEFFTGW